MIIIVNETSMTIECKNLSVEAFSNYYCEIFNAKLVENHENNYDIDGWYAYCEVDYKSEYEKLVESGEFTLINFHPKLQLNSSNIIHALIFSGDNILCVQYISTKDKPLGIISKIYDIKRVRKPNNRFSQLVDNAIITIKKTIAEL